MRRLLALSLSAGILLTGCAPAAETAANQAREAKQLKKDVQSAESWAPAKVTRSVEVSLLPDAGSMKERLPAGARVEYATDTVSNGKRQIRIDNELRWIDALAIDPDSSAKSATASIPSVYVTKAKLTLLSAPHRGGRKGATVPKNAQVEQRGKSANNWVKVGYGRAAGWVQTKQLAPQPQHWYQATGTLKLRAKPHGGQTTATVPQGASAKSTGRTSGKYRQLVYRNRTGWAHSSQVTRALTVKYKLRGYTQARSKPGGTTQAHLYKNQVVGAVSSVRTKAKGVWWVKIRHTGKDLWIPAAKAIKVAKSTALNEPTKTVAKFKTTKAVQLRKTPNGQAAQNVSKGYVLGSPTNDKVRANSKTWLHIIHKSKHYWVDASTVKSVPNNTKLGPATAPNTHSNGKDLQSLTRTNWTDADYVAAIKKNIAPWCPSVPVKLTKTAGRYYATSHPLQITMSRVDNPNPNWGNILSVSLHECAHILQFTVYKNRLDDLDRDMDPLWGKKGMGAEYLADCMSDLMGGQRAGTLPNGWTYWSGYGQTCNSAQKSAAQKLLRGTPLTPPRN